MKNRDINRAKRVDPHCKNNNICGACRSSRLNQANKELQRSQEQMKEVKNEDNLRS